jgi:hypothetical protein
MKGRGILALLFVSVALLSGCKTTSSNQQTPPPLADGKGRIWFYRPAKFFGAGIQPVMHVGEAVAGTVGSGKAFYVDMPAGDYVLECSGMGRGVCSVSLLAAETKYIRLRLSFWAGFYPIDMKQFVLVPVDADTGLAGIKRCELRT